MVFNPDLSDPRYLDEIGWFLYHEANDREGFGGTYADERRAYSQDLLARVLKYCRQDVAWLSDKTVVSIGAGCTADLATWPARAKIAIDPLLNAYRKLEMLLDDEPGTGQTIYLAMGAEDLPIVDDTAHLLICRNALDHMLNPAVAVSEMARILKLDGLAYVDVDLGGEPTPDEPTVFSLESLNAVIEPVFDILFRSDRRKPNSGHRDSSTRLLLRKKPVVGQCVDKVEVLQTYVARFTKKKRN